MTQQHRTVSRIVGILEFVASKSDGSTLTEIADHLGAARSSIYGFLRGLVYEGYLEEQENGRYTFGLGAHLLLVEQSDSLIHLAEPVLREVTERFNETTTLAVQVGRSLSYVSSRQSTQRIVYLPTMLVRRPLWPTSAGKVFLAAMNDEQVQQLVNPKDIQSVLPELRKVRQRGFAFNIGETVADVSAVAVGLGVGESVTAAITVGGPHVRIEPIFEDIVTQMRQSISKVGLTAFEYSEGLHVKVTDS